MNEYEFNKIWKKNKIRFLCSWWWKLFLQMSIGIFALNFSIFTGAFVIFKISLELVIIFPRFDIKVFWKRSGDWLGAFLKLFNSTKVFFNFLQSPIFGF